MPKTTDEIYEAVLEVKSEVLDSKLEIITLRQHVNHEVEILTDKVWGIDKRIDGKLSADQLLTSIGFKLLNIKWIRWALGGVAAATITQVAASHWVDPFWTDLFSRILP